MQSERERIEGYLKRFPLIPKKKKPAPAKPKLVADKGEIVGEATVQVSPADPNYRPPGFVTIRYDLAEAQRAEREAERRHIRSIDPYRTGIWGNPDDDDVA